MSKNLLKSLLKSYIGSAYLEGAKGALDNSLTVEEIMTKGKEYAEGEIKRLEQYL